MGWGVGGGVARLCQVLICEMGVAAQSTVRFPPSLSPRRSNLLAASCRQDQCCSLLQGHSKPFWLVRCSGIGMLLSMQMLIASALPHEQGGR